MPPRRARSGSARRRASRTESGSGDQPASAAELDDRRARRSSAPNTSAGSPCSSVPSPRQVHDRIGVLHDALEAVFGHHHRDAEVVHEAGDRREHLFGRGGIEGGGGLVEHEHLRVCGEHGADGDPLQLARGELVERAVAEVGEAEQVEGLLDALAHHVGRDRELFHAVRELFFERVGHAAGEWILGQHAHDVGELARRVRARIAAVDRHASAEHAAGEVRHQTVDRAEQGRLAGSGAADHHAQLARGNRQVDVVQDGAIRVGIGDRHALEADHARVSIRVLIRGRSAPAGSRTSIAGALGACRSSVACDAGTDVGGGGGVSTAGSERDEDRGRGQQWERRPRGREDRRVDRAGVVARDHDHGGGGRDPRQRGDPLGERPRIGPVARAVHAAAAENESRDRAREAGAEHRRAEEARGRGVEEPVETGAQSE